ncbi:MAG: hypothetical protein PF517_03940 [Salinivirgaceae bacterium]|jgi:hypothetical protein|nr:hypothetical protein [Salinivirgaceae bacterium]
MNDTMIYLHDTIGLKAISDSLLHLSNKIEIICPENAERLIFGLRPELAGILISTIITISVFSLGVYIQWRGKKIDRLQVLKSYKTVLVEWIKLTEETITTQTKLYQKFAKELKAQENIMPISFVHEPYLINRLKELNLRELVDLIVINHKGNKVTNALSLLDIISHIQKLTNIEITAKEKYSEFFDYAKILGEQWNSSFKILDRYIKSLPTKTAHTENKNERLFYQRFSQVYNEYYSNADKSSTSKTLAEKLISKLEKTCNESIKSDPSLTEPNNISPILVELQFIEYRWSVFRDGIAEYYQNVSNKTMHVYFLLKEKAVQLENIQFKTWTKIQ